MFGGFGLGGGAWISLVFIAAVAAPLVATFVVLRLVERRAGRLPHESEAEVILRGRLATGEIDEEEYLRRLAALHRDP